MLSLYTAATPNGRKVSIMLEEVELPYQVHKLDLTKGDQHRPEFLAINPNGKIPAIVDGEVRVFESGAILVYLAEKTGRLLARDGAARYEALEWLMFQMSGVGPMFGQVAYFNRQPEKNLGAIERFTKEAQRILGVLDGRLAHCEHLAGEYSIADVATYPWVYAARERISLATPGAYPHVERWLATVGARPAVERGMKVPA